MKTKILITLVVFILSAVRVVSQPTINEHSIKFESQQAAVLAGENGLIMRTVDGGDNWAELTTGITNTLYSIDYYTYDNNGTEAAIHLAVGENGVILKSIDNGLTWSLKTSGTTEHLNEVIIVSGMFTAACGNNGTILYSYDLGETWTAVISGTTENLKDIYFIEGTDPEVSRELYYAALTGISAGSNGKIFKTTGISGNWSDISTTLSVNLSSICYLSGETFFAAGEGGYIVKTSDMGLTYETVTSGTAENINEMRFLDGTTAVASCDNGVILNSTDGGATWTVITTPTTSDLFSVSFSSSSFGISVGENGTEIYSTDAGLTWISKDTVPPPSADVKNNEVKLMQNFPNPFNPSTVISYQIPFDAMVTVKIYDMLGREVRTLVNSNQVPGTYSVSFNASSLASGIYFYVLRASSGSNEMTRTMKMILTK